MYKVTLVIEKWCDLNPSLGVTSGNSNIVGSLASTHLAEITTMYYDEYLHNHGYPIDNLLVRHCRETMPDAVIVSYYPFDNDPRNIALLTFELIQQLSIPIVFVWFDSVHDHILNLAIKLSHYATISVVIDTWNRPNDSFVPMWVPEDPTVFSRDDRERDIEVCFVGSRYGYSERMHYLSFVTSQYPPLQISGGQRDHRLTIEEYAEILKRAKMSINFPTKPDGREQAKSRIYETMMCGSLLLERDNEAIKRWFEPMIHYVPFGSPQDLLDKIKYYTQHEQERNVITEAGWQKVSEDYSAVKWWKYIFQKIHENK